MYIGKGRKIGVMGIPSASRAGVKKISVPCALAALVGNVVEGELENKFMSHRRNYLIRARESSGHRAVKLSTESCTVKFIAPMYACLANC